MLRSLKEMMKYTIEARDGELGRIKDLLVEERVWVVRYMVPDTRKWLKGHKVLIPPHFFGQPDDEKRRFPLKLTREEIKASPRLEEAKPVTREYEVMWHDHFGLSYYWVDEAQRDAAEHPLASILKSEEDTGTGIGASEKDHLLSVDETDGYRVQAVDGEIGHVSDFLADRQTWQICYAIIDTRNWLPGRHVCVFVKAIDFVDKARKQVGVGLSKEAIQNSPEYNPYVPISREYQMVLHDYYGWPKYWNQ